MRLNNTQGGKKHKRRNVSKVSVNNIYEIQILLSLPKALNNLQHAIQQHPGLTLQNNFLTFQTVEISKNICYGMVSFLHFYNIIRPHHKFELSLITSDFVEFHNANMKMHCKRLTTLDAQYCDSRANCERILTFSKFIKSNFKRDWHSRKLTHQKGNAQIVESSSDSDNSSIDTNNNTNDSDEETESNKSVSGAKSNTIMETTSSTNHHYYKTKRRGSFMSHYQNNTEHLCEIRSGISTLVKVNNKRAKLSIL
jgi:hypothetical protein